MKPIRRILIVSVLALLVISFAAFAGLARPALADGGAPLPANDGRWWPTTLDRLAVYCHDASVDVLGIDNNSAGDYLTTFNILELTSGATVVHKSPLGTVTLYTDAQPVMHYGLAINEATQPSLITDVGTQYHITWQGGPFGADPNQAQFVKTFSCTYLPTVSK